MGPLSAEAYKSGQCFTSAAVPNTECLPQRHLKCGLGNLCPPVVWVVCLNERPLLVVGDAWGWAALKPYTCFPCSIFYCVPMCLENVDCHSLVNCKKIVCKVKILVYNCVMYSYTKHQDAHLLQQIANRHRKRPYLALDSKKKVTTSVYTNN